jgi:ribonuclease J
MSDQKLKVIPLGGLGEIGKNMMVMEYADDIVIIDAGLMFPNEEMFGVELVVPDISYLEERQHKIKGIVITHGHEDHIGALPYILSRLDLPVYASKLTEGLISVELKQRGLKKAARVNVVHAGSEITLGHFKIEFFPVCHSIPDAMGLVITTPVGVVVHSGDFKMDFTPVLGDPADLSKLARLGARGVLLLFSDSTYVELPGYTPSEKVVGDALDRIMAEASGRVIVTTFASLVSRIQQVVDAAARHHRRVFVTGRSMIGIVKMAMETGYLTVPPDILCNFDDVRKLPDNRIVFLTTGSQGEPTSALVRIANGEHRQIHITPGDTVVISATPIPGNEALVNQTIDRLFRQGARVVYDKLTQVHVHGHASQEELKLLLSLVRPKFFVPVHGEYRHLCLHTKLAETMGIPRENLFVLEDGDVLELDRDAGKITGHVQSGNVYLSGLLTGNLNDAVLHDRKLLAWDGTVTIAARVNVRERKLIGKPEIIMQGFIGDGAKKQALLKRGCEAVISAMDSDGQYWQKKSSIEARMKKSLADFLYHETRRHPVILPVVFEG